MQTTTPFLGLAPFLRMSIAGSDMLPIGRELLAKAEQHPDDANLWMNLATVMFSLGHRDNGLAIQARALELSRDYTLEPATGPARCTLLMLVAAGDLSTNTPLDCLLEHSDIRLHLHYVSPEAPLAGPLPEHDALIVGISQSSRNRRLLSALEQRLANWPHPVLNAPQHIPKTDRDAASALLQNVPGLQMPPTLRTRRQVLEDIGAGRLRFELAFSGFDFPIILRPVGSHAGDGLERIASVDALADYLSRVADSEFFLAPFIDYSGNDGLFRKFRVALIDGEPFACHMAVSAHWMVHYVNAGMYEDAHKRQEEADFMTHFAAFAQRHRAALAAIHARTGLDYLCIDCAETRDGRLLVFEIDHAMVVHAMDTEDMFPYKQIHMRKVRDAFEALVTRRIAHAAVRT